MYLLYDVCFAKVEEYGDEVFDKLNQGAHIYFCGLKGMMPGILNMLEKVAKKKKLNWENFLKDLKKKGKSESHVSRKRGFRAQDASLNRAVTNNKCQHPLDVRWSHELLRIWVMSCLVDSCRTVVAGGNNSFHSARSP